MNERELGERRRAIIYKDTYGMQAVITSHYIMNIRICIIGKDEDQSNRNIHTELLENKTNRKAVFHRNAQKYNMDAHNIKCQ